jgi:hypothetical protein
LSPIKSKKAKNAALGGSVVGGMCAVGTFFGAVVGTPVGGFFTSLLSD